MERPFVLFITPTNFKTNLPLNTQIRIAFSENVVPNNGIILFHSEQNDIKVNVQNSGEVNCSSDVCVIQPIEGFLVGTYEMSFSESAFKDYSGNVLAEGVSSHIFTVTGTVCGLDYMNVDKNQNCYCQSVGDQCQCQCGETFFVKDY